jgi:hypothetical protein
MKLDSKTKHYPKVMKDPRKFGFIWTETDTSFMYK